MIDRKTKSTKIKSNFFIEEEFLMEGDANQLVIKTQLDTFNIADKDRYNNKFLELKALGIIKEGEFKDFIWTCKADNYESNIKFTLKKSEELNLAVKFITIRLLEKVTATTANTYVTILQECITLTSTFHQDMIGYFEDNLNNMPNHTLFRAKQICLIFLSFYHIENCSDYLELLDEIKVNKNGIRELPDYKSILIFDKAIHDFISSEAPDYKLKYYPLFLWWKITGIIPLRPKEFRLLSQSCCYKDNNNRYWIKVPRTKLHKNNKVAEVEIVNVLETTESIYNFINEYIRIMKPYQRGKFLISYKAYNSFIEPNYRDAAFKNKRNVEQMELSQVKMLFDKFYDEIVKPRYNYMNMTPLKPGDTRHLAFCNMMFQGLNPLTIARIGGHTDLKSQIALPKSFKYILKELCVYNVRDFTA